MNINIEQIRAAYSEEKRRADRSEWLAYFVIRPLSFYISALFIRLGISANSVTWFSLAIVLLAGLMIGFGDLFQRLVGCVLLLVWLILDHVDGNIARFTGTQSAYGDFIDSIAGYLVLGTLPLFLGLAAFFDHAGEQAAWIYLLLGGIAAVTNIMPRLFYQKLQSYRLAEKGYKDLLDISSERTGNRFKSMLLNVANNILNPSGLLLVIVMSAVLLNVVGWFVAAYAGINILLTIYCVIKFCRSF